MKFFQSLFSLSMLCKKEFELKIKCLRTDNGGEFLSNDFMEYCKKHEIKHQLTCPKTLQQNGVAERKLAHLISVCLSWLHARSLPRELWHSFSNSLPCCKSTTSMLRDRIITIRVDLSS